MPPAGAPSSPGRHGSFPPPPGTPDSVRINARPGASAAPRAEDRPDLYLPALKATMAVLLNTDIRSNDANPGTLLGRAVTRVIRPGNVYGDASDQN